MIPMYYYGRGLMMKAYKAEHAVDLGEGAVGAVVAVINWRLFRRQVLRGSAPDSHVAIGDLGFGIWDLGLEVEFRSLV